ncbi:MAG: FAD-dependent oxidoreductase [Mariprofundaceae bacterium]|nr:FAD-dependent oxidoreductase [Mariprofundaceae bacterium]
MPATPSPNTLLIRITNIAVELEDSDAAIGNRIAGLLKLKSEEIRTWQIVRKAVDARKKSHIHFVCTIECSVSSDTNPKLPPQAQIVERSRLDISKPELLNRSANPKEHVIVVGSGPAGLFAALALIEAGIQVTLLERGRPVESRMRDIGRLRSRGELNPESNICFGEGGAGTYTDGKLYTRIKHPYVRWVLNEFVRFGADRDILIDAHPHLGTDRLVRIIRSMREHLIEQGVDYRFETRVDALLTEDGKIRGVRCASGEEIAAGSVVLAIGHSARDTFEHLQAIGIAMQAKEFAVGVRAEHAQAWVNECQFGPAGTSEKLGAAEYSLTHQARDPYMERRGIYSFCMCPGGLIVPSPTENGMMAINGMSNARRTSPLANSGIVVQITPDDIARHGLGADPLCGIRMQRELELKTFAMTTQPYAAPAMRIADFVAKKATGLLATSRFKPGVEATDLWELIPGWLAGPLAEGLTAFDRKMRGFVTSDANILAMESRTSSPIRITRGEDMQSVNLNGLYPAGEGAGYAGGIVSAAVDGLKAAEKIISQT